MYYNINNYNLFIGQKDYLNTKEKDFKILKNNKKKNINDFNEKIKERKHNKFYIKFLFKRKRVYPFFWMAKKEIRNEKNLISKILYKYWKINKNRWHSNTHLI